MTQTALIAGAGIGGLVAALALAARGREVTLVERATGFTEVGAGIQLSPNASRVLADLGLGPALRRAAGEPERVRIRAIRSGREIGAVALGPHMRERYGAPSLVIHRADLQTLLLDAVRGRPSIRILVGRTVADAASDETRASLTVERSGGARETLQADILVGADGLRSGLRAATGDRRAPAFRKAEAWRTAIPLAQAPEALRSNEIGLWLGPGRHLVHYPVSGGRTLNVVAVEPAPEPVDGWAAEGDGDEIRRRYARAAPELRALLDLAREWGRWSLFDLPAGPLASGRIALLGDAAHPVLPFLAQGAGLAVEDAAALAACLDAHPDDPPAGLRAYEAARLPRVRRVQAEARRNGRVYHAPWPISAARNLVIRRLGPEGMSARYDWLYGWRG